VRKGGAQSASSIVLEAVLKNGVAVKRCLSLAGNRLDLRTTLTNTAPEKQDVALRCNLELSWPEGAEPFVQYRDTNGTLVKLGIPEPGHSCTLSYSAIADGQWTAQLGKAQLTQVFAQQPVASLACSGSRMDRGLTLVLTAEPTTLNEHEQISVEQSWIIS